MIGIKKVVPNFITSLNILSGSLAIVFAFENKFLEASILIGAALIFDYLDGMTARLLKAYSELGKQLDSLADVVSFGLAPSVFLYQLTKLVFIKNGQFAKLISPDFITILIFGSCFLVVVFSALRLAKFNIDDEQTTSFKGLPTPANAMFITSLMLICFMYENTIWDSIILSHYFLIPVSVVSSFLLVSNIPMFSLKIKSFSIKNNIFQYILLLISLILLITLHVLAIPLIIATYILLSIVYGFTKNKKTE